jgi:hypothetical protein
VVAGNVNTPNPIASERTVISREPIEQSVRRSIVCASGFGGPTAVLSLVSL